MKNGGLHLRLDDDDMAKVRELAEFENRTLVNMIQTLVKRGLAKEAQFLDDREPVNETDFPF